VLAGADDVVICSGFTQGTAFTLAALRAAGATSVAVEDPGCVPVTDQTAALEWFAAFSGGLAREP
jgi:hypothetical protein